MSSEYPKKIHPFVQYLDSWQWRVVITLLTLVSVPVAIGLTLVITATDINIDGDGNTVAFSPAVESPIDYDCPNGWRPLFSTDYDSLVFACTDGNPEDPQAGDWYVVLNEERTACDVAYQIDTPNAEFKDNCEGVPNWPQN